MKTASTIALAFAAFLLGCCAFRSTAPAWAGETDANRAVLAVTTSVDQSHEVVWLIDTEKRMMAMYDANRGQAIHLVAVRNFEWDLNAKILDYPKNAPSPTADEMKKFFEKDKADNQGVVGQGK